MKSEKELSKYLMPKLHEPSGGVCGWHIQSFEASINQATPDWYLTHMRKCFSNWMELKVEKDGKVEFQPGQVQWLENHSRKGGLATVLLLSPGPEGGLVRLFPASSARWLSTAKGLRERGGDLSARAVLSGPLSSPSLWSQIASYLLAESEDRWS